MAERGLPVRELWSPLERRKTAQDGVSRSCPSTPPGASRAAIAASSAGSSQSGLVSAVASRHVADVIGRGGPTHLHRARPRPVPVVKSSPKAATSRLAQSDPAVLAATGTAKVPLLVKLDYDSVATYSGGVDRICSRPVRRPRTGNWTRTPTPSSSTTLTSQVSRMPSPRS